MTTINCFGQDEDGNKVLDPNILKLFGPKIKVEISIPNHLVQYFVKNVIKIPSPIIGSGLIDTGASITAVDEKIINTLKIQPIDEISVYTPGGEIKQKLYPIKLTLVGYDISINFGRVTGSNLEHQGFQALLGRDILEHCLLVYNGTAGFFSISYD